MQKSNLQPNQVFDSLRGTASHKYQEPTFESYPSLDEYKQNHAGRRFISARIQCFHRWQDKPIVDLWEDVPLDHDHLFQCMRLLLKVMNEWQNIDRVRVDFAGDVINPFQIQLQYDPMPIDVDKERS